jgi:hypothetical protein
MGLILSFVFQITHVWLLSFCSWHSTEHAEGRQADHGDCGTPEGTRSHGRYSRHGICRFVWGLLRNFPFRTPAMKENARRIELRPILDREFPHWQIVFNPVFVFEDTAFGKSC